MPAEDFTLRFVFNVAALRAERAARAGEKKSAESVPRGSDKRLRFERASLPFSRSPSLSLRRSYRSEMGVVQRTASAVQSRGSGRKSKRTRGKRTGEGIFFVHLRLPSLSLFLLLLAPLPRVSDSRSRLAMFPFGLMTAAGRRAPLGAEGRGEGRKHQGRFQFTGDGASSFLCEEREREEGGEEGER